MLLGLAPLSLQNLDELTLCVLADQQAAPMCLRAIALDRTYYPVGRSTWWRRAQRAGKHRVPFQQKLVHEDQSTSGPRPAGHVPIQRSKSTGLVVAVLRVGLQQEGARPRISGWTTDFDS
jgi:hypothetical protein